MNLRSLAPFALSLLVAGTASAQPAGDTTAEAVFEQGLQKLEAGDFDAACPLLARAVELSSTEALGGMLTLAECYEKTARPASAWGLYKRVAARAGSTGETARAETARAAAARLEPTLPRIAFKTPPDAPADLAVLRGKERIPADVWSVPVPFDPGEITLVFEAPGRAQARKTVTVPQGPSEIVVEAPALAPASGSSAPSGPPVSGENAGGGLGGLGIAGIVIGGLGLASLGAGIGVAVDAKGKWNDAVTADCNGDPARCQRLDGIDSARSQGDVGSILFGVGAGLAATGVTLLIIDLATAGSSTADAAQTGLRLELGPFGGRAHWSFQ